IQAYLTPNLETTKALSELRLAVRDGFRVATTAAFGPRYLHSTGQLHKGGPARGILVQVTADDPDDLAIPRARPRFAPLKAAQARDDVASGGAGHGFATLKAAQALGDIQALHEGGRRVIRLHLKGKQVTGLDKLVQLVRSAARRG